MKNLLWTLLLMFPSRQAFSDATTSRLGGLTVPIVNSFSWGPKINNDMFQLSTNAASQVDANTYSSSQTVNAPIQVSTINATPDQIVNGSQYGVYITSNLVVSGALNELATGASQYSLTTSSGIKISAGSISATVSTMTASQINGTNSIIDSGLTSCANGVTTDASGKLTCSGSGVPLTTNSSPTLTGQWTFNVGGMDSWVFLSSQAFSASAAVSFSVSAPNFSDVNCEITISTWNTTSGILELTFNSIASGYAFEVWANASTGSGGVSSNSSAYIQMENSGIDAGFGSRLNFKFTQGLPNSNNQQYILTSYGEWSSSAVMEGGTGAGMVGTSALLTKATLTPSAGTISGFVRCSAFNW